MFKNSKTHPLSIVILTYNSQKYLSEVLRSASFANEILIIDSGSTDRTLEIAQEAGCRIIHQDWLGFGRQKQKGVESARNDWVMVLDSDEIIPEDLQKEILQTLSSPEYRGYMIPRLNYFFDKPMRHGGLYPDKTLRLFHRNFGRFDTKEVHEKVQFDGPVGHLRHHLVHYAYDSIEQFIDKQNRYSSLGAKHNRLKALVNPTWTFLKMYVLKFGFLDGWHGYIVARLYAQYTFWKYAK